MNVPPGPDTAVGSDPTVGSGAVVGSRSRRARARLGDGYAFVATALGTIRHQGVDTPPPDTVEGLLYAHQEDRCVIDAPRPATALADTRPAPRASPWVGYAPLDPARLADSDGLVFVKDVHRNQCHHPT